MRADGIPVTVRAVLDTCPVYANARLVEGLFERQVDLGTAGRASQTDLMVLVKSAQGYAAIAVEGKAEEPF